VLSKAHPGLLSPSLPDASVSTRGDATLTARHTFKSPPRVLLINARSVLGGIYPSSASAHSRTPQVHRHPRGPDRHSADQHYHDSHRRRHKHHQRQQAPVVEPRSPRCSTRGEQVYSRSARGLLDVGVRLPREAEGARSRYPLRVRLGHVPAPLQASSAPAIWLPQSHPPGSARFPKWNRSSPLQPAAAQPWRAALSATACSG